MLVHLNLFKTTYADAERSQIGKDVGNFEHGSVEMCLLFMFLRERRSQRGTDYAWFAVAIKGSAMSSDEWRLDHNTVKYVQRNILGDKFSLLSLYRFWYLSNDER